MNNLSEQKISEFVHHYLVAALWSSHDYRNDEDSSEYDPEHSGENMDDSYSPEDASPQTLAEAWKDVVSFVNECTRQGIDLSLYGGNHQWSNLAQHGHDLWLTRCGHGIGFWDRGYGEAGQKMSKIARLMGNKDCVNNGAVFSIE